MNSVTPANHTILVHTDGLKVTYPVIFLTKASFCSSVTWTCLVRLLELTPRTALVNHAWASCGDRQSTHQPHLPCCRDTPSHTPDTPTCAEN